MEGRNVGTHQGRDVQKHAEECEAYRVPAIGGDSLGFCEIQLHAEHFLHDFPDVIKWHKCNERADSREDHGKDA